jgi:DNA invertase Pin-like site-specific DNA recombinase
MSDTPIRCAIYTRKSSEEGLDQSFNSLDAQREAGEAYVKSQSSEGWTLLSARYDDGGFSGGTLERPGLQRLLADIEAGLIDVVVVYKIDRLTRSLADFARIVEVFEKAGASFVSVTQSFNTTNSMGRLMLNVLLSFAQFEREVTGERIRDKIAASKAKGLWMGGNPPLGYDLPDTGTRILKVNEAEAPIVRSIFTRYLELGSVHALERELIEYNIFSKQRTTRHGKVIGGGPFSRGALFHLLRNRIYLGQIVHRDEVHAGEHEAIVDDALFARVQDLLDRNARRHRSASTHRITKAPLTGKLFDATGEVMSPTFSRGKQGRSYRYYVSTSLQQGGSPATQDHLQRISAPAIERLLTRHTERWLGPGQSLDCLAAVHFSANGLLVDLPAQHAADIAARLEPGERIIHADRCIVRLAVELALPLRGGAKIIQRVSPREPQPDPILIAALRKAHRMIRRERGLPLVDAAPHSPYDRRILRLAFLAPDIQQGILAGHQPPYLNLEALRHIDLPLDWQKQREVLRWRAVSDSCSAR